VDRDWANGVGGRRHWCRGLEGVVLTSCWKLKIVHLTDRANATYMRRLSGLRGIDWQVRFDSSTMRCIKRCVSAEMVSAMQCSRAQFPNEAISLAVSSTFFSDSKSRLR
jgi:hypothetical protein